MGLEDTKFDQNIAVVHSDERRIIYDPEKILSGLDDFGYWFSHNIITISAPNLSLGGHHHDYHEIFFTPTGGFDFRLVDNESKKRKDYVLAKGSRILIPPYVTHMVNGEEGSVLMGFGNQKFTPEGLIKSNEDILAILETK